MKRSSLRGWPRDAIKAALRKAGYSFRRIGREHGYRDPRQPGDVLRYRWPFMEKVVAEILGVPPHEIWPERYKADGSPVGRGIRGRYAAGAGAPARGRTGLVKRS